MPGPLGAGTGQHIGSIGNGTALLLHSCKHSRSTRTVSFVSSSHFGRSDAAVRIIVIRRVKGYAFVEYSMYVEVNDTVYICL